MPRLLRRRPMMAPLMMPPHLSGNFAVHSSCCSPSVPDGFLIATRNMKNCFLKLIPCLAALWVGTSALSAELKEGYILCTSASDFSTRLRSTGGSGRASDALEDGTSCRSTTGYQHALVKVWKTTSTVSTVRLTFPRTGDFANVFVPPAAISK